MKVICVGSGGYSGISVGKTYNTKSLLAYGKNSEYLIENNYGYSFYYPAVCFKSLDDIRDERIKKILG